LHDRRLNTNVLAAMALFCMLGGSAHGQRTALPPVEATSAPVQDPAVPRRIHLIMQDGSYQLVLSYKVDGNIVHFRSADRNGEIEEVPLALVDLEATKKWVAAHRRDANADPQSRSVLTPELAKEEADRAARTPEVAPDLRLPEEDCVLVLDTFSGSPELVPLSQNGGDLNKETAHDVLKQAINPASSPHRLADIRGVRSDVQLHVPQPDFFVRIGTDDAGDTSGGAFVVDTHGAPGRDTPSGSNDSSSYVIERLDVRMDLRVLDSFRLASLGVKPQPDIIEVQRTDLPGGHWMKLTPTQPLPFGEYALVEVLNNHEVNLDVWDFGVHSDAPENVEAIRPTPSKPITLERRRPD